MDDNTIIDTLNTEYNVYIHERKWLIDEIKRIIPMILDDISLYQLSYIDWDKLEMTMYEMIFDGLLNEVTGGVDDWTDEILFMLEYTTTTIDEYKTKHNIKHKWTD